LRYIGYFIVGKKHMSAITFVIFFIKSLKQKINRRGKNREEKYRRPDGTSVLRREESSITVKKSMNIFYSFDAFLYSLPAVFLEGLCG
jgi:hypothetical protein